MTPTGPTPPPYGTDDAGGFRNVLPPGSKGVDNAADLARFQASGQRPEHFDDQQPLYDGLIGASPHLTHDQISKFCGGGSKSSCRRALQASLRDALKVGRDRLYEKGDCSKDPQASCFDANRSIVASAIDVPPAPFQNRPTFQQTVELTRRLPR